MSASNSQEPLEVASPLQRDLARKILQHIREKALPIGTRLSAPELARTFNVSRSPIGAALGVLIEVGVLGLTDTRRVEIVRDVSHLEIDGLIPRSPYDVLYRRIMLDRARGDLAQNVTEAELIPRYDTARGVLRKVLLRFAEEGLARRMQGHGWQFLENLPDADSIRQSYDFRILIECGGLRLDTFSADPVQISRLRQAHHDVIAKSSRGISASSWLDVNTSFHETLAGFSNNEFIATAVQQQNNLRRMREAAIFNKLPFERVQMSCNEHLAILDAVELGNHEWAEALMREHLKKAVGK